MAQQRSDFLVFATLIFLLSCHHASSWVSPTSTITTFLSIHNNVIDKQAVLSFKHMISSDPGEFLASWNDSIQFCQWPGISCGGRRHPERVVSLNLSSLDLAGFIPPMIANLTFLRKIDLSDNQIHGSIPQEIDRLFRLQHLNLSMNSLDGGIPASLFHCSKLKVIRGIHAPGRNSIQSLQLLRPSNPIFEEQQSNTIHTAFFRKPLISFCSIHGAKQT